MAKKFARGVTGVDDIEKFDKTLTNVNDLISDGENTYVHTKKGKVESYYNLTDNLKEILSDDSNLITVTKDDTTNKVTLHPKHDAQKEQSLESTRGTVSIQKGGNGTNTTTKVDTNPQKVLEHVNLLTDYGISKTSSGNTTKLGFEYSSVSDGYDLNNLVNGSIKSGKFLNAPIDNYWFFVSSYASSNYTFQEAYTVNEFRFKLYKRYKDGNVWQPWREQVGDKSVIDGLLAQKQNTITNNESIGVVGSSLRQLYYAPQTYSEQNGLLKTHRKSMSLNSNTGVTNVEFNFIVKINKNAASVSFTLSESDRAKFESIINTYGSNGTVRISGCVFTLSGSTLTVSTSNNTNQNYVITFSDII